MKTLEVRRIGGIAAAVVCLLGLLGACARSVEDGGGSGETHFLSTCSAGCGAGLSCLGDVCTRPCEGVGETMCADLGAGASCEALPAGGEERGCDVRCAHDTDCSVLGAGFDCPSGRCRVLPRSMPDAGPSVDTGTPMPTPECPTGCEPVNGYAEAPGRGCADRSRIGFVACDCNPEAAFVPRCGRRTADDSLWVFYVGELAPDSGIVDCTFEESDRVNHACEYDACEVPVLSVCSFEDTCGDGRCEANLAFDAQGCERPLCTSDAECAADQRCVPLSCVSASWCVPKNPGPDEICMCSGPAACGVASYCNPVATVGPRGVWQALEFVTGNSFCMTSCTDNCAECSETRRLEPGGLLTIKPMGTTDTRRAMLSELELQVIEQMIDGPSLRPGLRDGFVCEIRVADAAATLRLELPDETLEQDVSQCAFGYSPDEHEVARLREQLGAY